MDQCHEIRYQHHGKQIRGHALRESVELSPRKKVMLSNMFRAESFSKTKGGSCRALHTVPKELQDLE